MASEFDRYIPEIQALGIKELPEWQIQNAARVLGDWMLNTKPTSAQMEATKRYLHSKARIQFEKVIFTIIHKTVTNKLSDLLASKIQAIDPPTSGYFTYQVGFSRKNLVEFKKVRSLKKDANEILSRSPFGEAMWQSNTHYLDHLIIPHKLAKRIRSGPDEMAQLGLVAKGKQNGHSRVSLISNRPFMEKELEGIEILQEMKGRSELGFSPTVQRVVADHESIMLEQDTPIGIVNPMSALNLGEGSFPMLRLYAGIQYATCGASLPTDFRILVNSGLLRVGKLLFNSNGVKT